MLRSLFFVLLIFICSTDSYSQNIATPNPGFENWNQVANYFNPVGWNNLNSNTALVGVFTCTRASAPADVHSGTYAIKLTTKSVFGITANGIASTATLITTPPYGVSGGIPYTERPDSIVGWFKYTPASAADSGFVQFVLLGASNDTIGFVNFHTPNSPVTTFTRFSKAITYSSANTPVNSYWILSASDGVNPVVNSSMIVDDINLIFNSTGVQDVQSNNLIHLQSNIINENIVLENNTSENTVIRIFDVSGRLIKQESLIIGTSRIDFSSVRSGIYIYNVSNLDGVEVISGKLLKW